MLCKSDERTKILCIKISFVVICEVLFHKLLQGVTATRSSSSTKEGQTHDLIGVVFSVVNLMFFSNIYFKLWRIV